MVDPPDTDWRARVAGRPAVVVALVTLVATLAVALGGGGVLEPPASPLSGSSDTPTPPAGTTTVSRGVLGARTPTPVGSVAAAPPATPTGEGPRRTRSPPRTPAVTPTPRRATSSPTTTDQPPPTATGSPTATESPTATGRPSGRQTPTEPPARQTTRSARGRRPESPDPVVVGVRADAPGADRTNLTSEFVVLRNPGDRPLDVGNWTLADADGHRYRFPPTATLPANESVRLHTGVGWDTARHRYWNRSTPVWNNAGDVVVVRDADGRVRVRHRYGTATRDLREQRHLGRSPTVPAWGPSERANGWVEL